MAKRKSGLWFLFEWPFWVFWGVCVYLLQTQFGLGTLQAALLGFPAIFLFFAFLVILLRIVVFVFDGNYLSPPSDNVESGKTEKPKKIFVGVAVDEHGVEETQITTDIELQKKHVKELSARTEHIIGLVDDVIQGKKTGDEVTESVKRFLEQYPDDKK